MVVKPALHFAVAFFLVASARADWTVAATEKDRAGGGRMEHRHLVLTENGRRGHSRARAFLHEIGHVASDRQSEGRARSLRSDGARALPGRRQRRLLRSRRQTGRIADQRRENDRAVAQGAVTKRHRRCFGRTRSIASGRGIFLETKGRRGVAMRTISGRSRPTGPWTGRHRSARRTFIAICGADRVLIGFCSPVTLAQLAKILAKPGLGPDLKVQRALNLDGGSSSAFWFAGERGAFSISEQKTVRDFVGVVPK